jgi:hypothetical protein
MVSTGLLPVGVSNSHGQTLRLTPEFLIGGGVAQANSDYTNPGRTGIGSDGTNFLVVFPRTLGSPMGLVGEVVSGGGVVQQTIQISADISQFSSPAVGFDGTNYMVVFQRNGQILGERVSPSGAVLDTAGGFAISSGIPFVITSFAPSLAFDGTNYLVVWQKYISDQNIFGARVTPSGQVLDEFSITTNAAEQVFASVAFDGTNYLVVWQDNRLGISPDYWTDIYGARVTPQGGVLDTNPIPICTAPGNQSIPSVAWSGTNYLVAWIDGRTGDDYNPAVYCARIGADGVLMDGPPESGGVAITTAPNQKGDPRVAFDGQNYFVAWWMQGYTNNPPGEVAGLYLARIDPGGKLLDGPVTNGGVHVKSPICWACQLAYPDLLFNGANFLLTWLNNDELQGSSKDILGAFIVPSSGQPVAVCASLIVTNEPGQCSAAVSAAQVGAGSYDPEGGPVTLMLVPSGPFPVGSNSVVLTVTDTNGANSTCMASIVVVDREGPHIGPVRAQPEVLWPPNHQMVDVAVDYIVADACDSGASISRKLTVTCSEPQSGKGGQSEADWQILDEHHVRLRAERAGIGEGRVYTITVTCRDSSGNSTVRNVSVAVPKSQGM